MGTTLWSRYIKVMALPPLSIFRPKLMRNSNSGLILISSLINYTHLPPSLLYPLHLPSLLTLPPQILSIVYLWRPLRLLKVCSVWTDHFLRSQKEVVPRTSTVTHSRLCRPTGISMATAPNRTAATGGLMQHIRYRYYFDFINR